MNRALPIAAALLAIAAEVPADTPPRAGIASVAGRWLSSYGLLDLSQQGDRVTGTYSCCDGTLDGEIEGSRLSFRWRDAIYGEGWGVFTVTDRGDRLIGRWGRDAGAEPLGEWHALRVPAGDASYWRVEGRQREAGTFRGLATLATAGTRISGGLVGGYTRDQASQLHVYHVVNLLIGEEKKKGLSLRWSNPLDGSAGSLKLRRQGTALRGRWTSAFGLSQGELAFTRLSEDGAGG